VTQLSARTLGINNFLRGLVLRPVAAYNITDPQGYALVTWAYVASSIHNGSETFAYRLMKVGTFGPLMSFVVDSAGLIQLLWVLRDAV
jgi:hypothetical protein